MAKKYPGVVRRRGKLGIRYYIGNRQIEEMCPGAETEKDAADIRSELLRQAQKGEWKPRSDRIEIEQRRPENAPKFKKVIELYEKDWKPTRKNQAWQKGMIGTLMKEFGDTPIPYMTPARIDRWKAKLKKTCSDRTIRKYLWFLSGVFRRTLETQAGRKLIHDNPVRMVRKPPEGKGLKKALTEAQAKALLAALTAKPPKKKDGKESREKENQDLFRWAIIMLKTGMRAEEVRDLTWDRVNIKTGQIRVTDTKTGTPRIVEAGSELLPLLKEWKLSTGKEKRVIGAVHKLIPRRRLSKVFKRAKIPYSGSAGGFTLRNLRTTFCMLAFNQGAKPEDLIAQTGHSLATLMAYYAEADRERRLAAVEKMPRLLTDEASKEQGVEEK